MGKKVREPRPSSAKAGIPSTKPFCVSTSSQLPPGRSSHMDLPLSSFCRIPVSTDLHVDDNQVCCSLLELPPNFRLVWLQLDSSTKYPQALGSLYWKYNSLSPIFLSFDDVVQAGNLGVPCSLPHIAINFHPAGGTAGNCPCLAWKGRRQLCPVHYCTPVPACMWVWPFRGTLCFRF